MCGLLTASLETPLAFPDPETSEPLYILGRVVAPAALGTAGEWQRSEPLAEPEPTGSYAELADSLTNRECMLLLKHAPTLKLADNFI